jgi:ribose transport system substrate-binding protein
MPSKRQPVHFPHQLILLPMLRSLIVGSCLLSGLISCRPASERSADDRAAAAKPLTIAMIPKGTTHSYWKTVHAGAQKAAQELDVTLYWQGPLKEDDRQIQIQTLQNFISRGVDAIALAPLDARSLVAPVKTAHHRGIPVIIFDSDLASTDYQSFVATDNRQGGRLCAERMRQVLGEKGKVIRMHPGTAIPGLAF